MKAAIRSGEGAPSTIVFKTSQLEGLKWLGLFAMTGDHINKYLLNYTAMPLFELGRLAMPIFGFVLAYNLARPGTLENGTYRRVQLRLFAFALVASPFYIGLGGVTEHWLPLNILFTLLAATAMMQLVEIAVIKSSQGRMAMASVTTLAAAAVFLASGWAVEFGWQGLAWCWFTWLAVKTRTLLAALLAAASLASLTIVNDTWWAMAALPVILVASFTPARVFRLRHFFYWFYPAHLAAIYLARIPMADAGYWFIIN